MIDKKIKIKSCIRKYAITDRDLRLIRKQVC